MGPDARAEGGVELTGELIRVAADAVSREAPTPTREAIARRPIAQGRDLVAISRKFAEEARRRPDAEARAIPEGCALLPELVRVTEDRTAKRLEIDPVRCRGLSADVVEREFVIRHFRDQGVVEIEEDGSEVHRVNGSRTANSAPPPSMFDARIEPPCACAIACAIARPRPVPSRWAFSPR